MEYQNGAELAFVVMRRAIAYDNERLYKLENKVEKLNHYKKPRRRIGFIADEK